MYEIQDTGRGKNKIFEYVEIYYNIKRAHVSLGNLKNAFYYLKKLPADLRKDPKELKNVYKDYPKVVKSLKDRLEDWKNNLVVYKDEESEFVPGVSEETRERIKNTGYW